MNDIWNFRPNNWIVYVRRYKNEYVVQGKEEQDKYCSTRRTVKEENNSCKPLKSADLYQIMPGGFD